MKYVFPGKQEQVEVAAHTFQCADSSDAEVHSCRGPIATVFKLSVDSKARESVANGEKSPSTPL